MAFDNRTYRRALEAQTRRIGDYERIHFRKSHVPKVNDSLSGYELTQDSRNPERPLIQPRVLEFSRATAKAFLQQTESLWLKLDISRQDATEQLLDRKLGSFFVRSSTKAKYALTVRLENNNPPVMHFLVHCNDQGFYIIQGSNLQFVSLYDLLAFFCFQQSGGMPCLLRPPVRGTNRDSYLLDSDDGDSDCEDEEWEHGSESLTSPPPSIPKYDEINHNHPVIADQYSTQPPSTDNAPPPLPPRRRALQCAYFEVSTETLNRVSRVSSLVDKDTGALINQVERNERLFSERGYRTKEEPTPPTPLTGDSRGDDPREDDPFESSTKLPPYKNFKIINEQPLPNQTRISDHYEIAPIKEVVVPLHTTPPMFEDMPPALPPKAQPPPIPPRGTAKNRETVIEAPPPLPPKPRPPPTKPRSNTAFPPESDYSVSRISNMRRLGHRRVSSDSSIISGSTTLSEDPPTVLTPPPIPPNHPNRLPLQELEKKEEQQVEEESSHVDEISQDWTMVEAEDEPPPQTPVSPTGRGSSHHGGRSKWKKPRWAKKIRKWRLKPGGRVKKYVLELSDDTNTQFGARIHYFIETTLMKKDPHQKLFSDVRKFMGKMRELLLVDYKTELLLQGMDSCKNFEHLLESILQQCIIEPIYSFLYTSLKDNLTQNGSMGQMKAAINNARNKSPEDLGIRPHLLVPNEKALQEINNIFVKIINSYNAMRKMEYLLEAVRLTYEGVRDANNPKKQMHDLGADDFLPLFVWVLAHTNFSTAEIEAEYIWGLAHPSLFNGEGGYYLTTLTSAVNVLKECCVDCAATTDGKTGSDLPNMNSLKTELPICIQDPATGKIGSPISLPVLPTMTVSEICDVLANQYNISEPHLYGLYTQTTNQVMKLQSNEYPQEIIISWAFQSQRQEEEGGSHDSMPVLVYKREE